VRYEGSVNKWLSWQRGSSERREANNSRGSVQTGAHKRNMRNFVMAEETILTRSVGINYWESISQHQRS